jgi:1-acyl-sn-glycerol-3-phosphate acyltransferase
MGGIAVDRSAAHGVVGQAVRHFAGESEAAARHPPKGTRRRVERWRSGFYHIALQAGVPVVVVGLDWGRRTVRIGGAFRPAGDETRDLRTLQRFFAGARGKVPDNTFPPPDSTKPGD